MRTEQSNFLEALLNKSKKGLTSRCKEPCQCGTNCSYAMNGYSTVLQSSYISIAALHDIIHCMRSCPHRHHQGHGDSLQGACKLPRPQPQYDRPQRAL